MRVRRISILPVVFAGMIMAGGCTKKATDTSKLYVPTASDATATATLEELQQGRALYIDQCGSCHGFYNPDSFNSSQWSSIMSSMAPKTSLNGSETQLVTKYVKRGKN